MPIAKRHYRDAVTRMLRATGLATVPEAALLVATLKDLAEQLDNGAGGRAMTAWISAQTKLQRFIEGRAAVAEKRPVGRPRKTPVDEVAKVAPPAEADNDLTKFRRSHGIPA